MNCIIVHGGNDDEEEAKEGLPENERHWQLWLKKELEERGIITSTELYPKDWAPVYENWKEVFEKNIINENTILIGHSDGGSFLVRWLGETKKKVRKLILIAPWKISTPGDTIRKIFYDYNIDYDIKKRVDKIIIFISDNECVDGKQSLKIFHEALGGKVIELNGRGHYTMGDMKTERFPELLNEILE